MKKRVISIVFAIFLVSLSVLPVFAISDGAAAYGRLVDNARLLTDEEYGNLKKNIDDVSEKYNFDVVIVTEKSIGDKTPTEYADDYFDYNGYGEGDDHDGILFLLNMETRKWAISTTGAGIPYFTDSIQSKIMDSVLPSLKSGDYYDAFSTFVEECDTYIYQGVNDISYGDDADYSNGSITKSKIPVHYIVIGGIFGGAFIGAIVVLIMKSKLKSVRMQPLANSYVKSGSFNVTEHTDLYLYRHVSKTAKPKDNGGSSGGGSSTHTSSSGTTHGGSSGSF